MPNICTPTVDHLPINKLKKVCADMIKQAKEDRSFAKDAYLFFKNIVDNPGETTDLDARKSMLDCLKLMQSAQTTAIRGIETFVKAESKLSQPGDPATGSTEPPSWKDLNKLS